MSRRRRRKARPVAAAKHGIPVEQVGAAREGEEAGSDADLRWERVKAGVLQARAAANRHFKTAKRLSGHARAAAEGEARLAIEEAVRAFWRAEETELEDEQHELMHRIGRWTRQTFGCHLHFDGSSYEQRCPIAIAHRRMGLSPGFTSLHVCSICGDDLSECSHIQGRAYWVRGGPGPSGYCPVCMKTECRHRGSRLYRVSVTAIITDLQAREISFVRRPAQPEARLRSLSISTEGLADALGPGFRPGMPVSCDRCLGPCKGFEELAAFDR